MSIALYLKNNLKQIPPGIGQVINHLPFGLRPGLSSSYRKTKKQILQLEVAEWQHKISFVFDRIKKLVDHSYTQIPFYKDLYDSHHFDPASLQSLKDIQYIPIITKAMLNEYSIDNRSFPAKNRYRVNTGGSSGNPFGFYIQPDSMGHEWAHMHTIWEKLGHRCHDLKLTFGGRSDVKNLVEYDVLRNSFAVDIYAAYPEVSKRLKYILRKHKIRYLHGYPSSIYDFAIYCDQEDTELKDLLAHHLRGAFLGSEYPHKGYRDKIEKVFCIPTVSWYGHTERATLAYEKEEPFSYFPFLSYGFSEAVKNKVGEYNLVSTAYYNYASPLIRYNTEDVIEDPTINEGILESFRILKGRSGEFVLDRDGKKVNLTGLIFGRHHELFDYANFIQVRQNIPGHIDILYVSKYDIDDPERLFDTRNLNFEVKFERREEPVRTEAGKVSLRVGSRE